MEAYEFTFLFNLADTSGVFLALFLRFLYERKAKQKNADINLFQKIYIRYFKAMIIIALPMFFISYFINEMDGYITMIIIAALVWIMDFQMIYQLYILYKKN